jgi:hypothetical protein
MVVVRYHRELTYENKVVFGLFYRDENGESHIDVVYNRNVLQRIDDLFHEALHLLTVHIVRCDERLYYDYHNYPCVIFNLLIDYLTFIKDCRLIANPSDFLNAVKLFKYVRSPKKCYRYSSCSTS